MPTGRRFRFGLAPKLAFCLGTTTAAVILIYASVSLHYQRLEFERTAVQDVFEKRAREAGLPPSIHAYQLRHTFAVRLLARGVGVKAIGDVMGHRSLLSTWPYLRLDMRALRGVALPVPPVRFRTEGVRHA
jgi:site-specific recombinase XerD